MKKFFIFTIVVIIVGFVFLFRNMFFPSDWAIVEIRGLQPNIREFYLVTESGGSVSALNWYISKGLKHPMSPKFCNPQWRRTVVGSFVADIQWDVDSSVGIVYRSDNDEWFLHWFEDKNIKHESFFGKFFGGYKILIHYYEHKNDKKALQEVIDKIK